MIGDLLPVVGLAALALLCFLAGRIWQDARQWELGTREAMGQALAGAFLPNRYWWGARLEVMPPQAQSELLLRETRKLGLGRADSLCCPLCGAEIPHAWAFTAGGRVAVAAGPVECPACDFRLDACRHCDHFMPGSPPGWGASVWSQGDITFGRCGFYKRVQPVEQALSGDVARRLKSRGYDQIPAPMPIQDSMLRPDSCRAFAANRKRIQASGIRWPGARCRGLLYLLSLSAESEMTGSQ
jgi:hypothetical protein